MNSVEEKELIMSVVVVSGCEAPVADDVVALFAGEVVLVVDLLGTELAVFGCLGGHLVFERMVLGTYSFLDLFFLRL